MVLRGDRAQARRIAVEERVLDGLRSRKLRRGQRGLRPARRQEMTGLLQRRPDLRARVGALAPLDHLLQAPDQCRSRDADEECSEKDGNAAASASPRHPRPIAMGFRSKIVCRLPPEKPCRIYFMTAAGSVTHPPKGGGCGYRSSTRFQRVCPPDRKHTQARGVEAGNERLPRQARDRSRRLR